MLGKEIKVQHSLQLINHIQLRSGKYMEIYFVLCNKKATNSDGKHKSSLVILNYILI